MTPTAGSYPIGGVDKLPHVTVAFPGEHWSNRVASGVIVPGEAVVPVASAGGHGRWRTATAADSAKGSQVAIALKTVQVPDRNPGSQYNESLGPNDIVNRNIVDGEYVHAYYSGAFHLTLIDPRDTYSPGDIIGWSASGQRPVGISGTGSWRKSGGNTDIDDVYEVLEFRPLGPNLNEGLLTVRSFRGQF